MEPAQPRQSWAAAVALLAFVLAFNSNPSPIAYYDYTARIASALLEGRLGITEEPPRWLNEMVPVNGVFYSVFPLGSVLTMLPVALLQKACGFHHPPAGAIAGAIAATVAAFSFLLAGKYELGLPRRLLLAAFPIFGTWTWCNLVLGGAWQLAQGFAAAGELGALYFVVVKRRPFIAGVFFAAAFGNRTEIILLAPLFFYLLLRDASAGQRVRTIAAFSAVPFVLGLATLAYNGARFGSPLDFGYARIPGVLEEKWYRHGIFSIHAIPSNAWRMLFSPGWRLADGWPWLLPTEYAGSIFVACPYLFFIFRKGARQPGLKLLSWIAIGVLTLVLWLHGEPGGWQFSYRYAIELLPWCLLLLIENSPPRVSRFEAVVFGVSVAINAFATYLFCWTEYIHP